jgi:hypothetical protein
MTEAPLSGWERDPFEGEIEGGRIYLRIIVEGRPPDTPEPGQTAFAHRAVNAMDKATLFLDAVGTLDRERGERNSIRGHRLPISLPGRRPGASS